MENQEDLVKNNSSKKNTQLGGQEGVNEGSEGTEVNPSKLNDNTEIDLDRSGVNTDSDNDEKPSPQEHRSSASAGYQGNTPDIDEETYKYGKKH